MAVAVQFDVPIVIVLLNDGGYGALEPQQQMQYGRSFGVDLQNPDFVALAAAYGIEGGARRFDCGARTGDYRSD